MLETKDLSLHAGSPEDWEALYENLWRHETAFRYMFTHASPTPQAAQKRTAAYAAMHRSVPTEFFVYEKSSDQAIGIAGLKKLDPTAWTVTDIALGPAFTGKGYGKQVLQALLHLAFAVLHAETVNYDCFAENTISRHLALSCGFSYSHAEPAELQKDGQPVVLEYYSCQKS